MEERILEAVEYITISLDDIKDYQDFIKYKPELMKAINDIKNIVQKKVQINENDTIEKGETDKSKLSSILGLQFDYDPLINEEDVKFFSDYEEKNNDKKIKNRINNKNNIAVKKINNNKNYSLRNPDNVLNCTESLRNKNRLLNKKNKIPIRNLKKNINKEMLKSEVKKSFNEKKKKEKIDIITDIIIKINNKDYLYNILTKLFGDNLSDKLLSKQVSDELLDSVQNAILEIEKINEKYKKINNINERIEKLYQEKIGIMKDQTRKENTKENNINNINYKYNEEQNNFFYRPRMYKTNSFHTFKYSEPYQEFNFKKSLRNQACNTFYKIQKKDNSINQSKINLKNKRTNFNSKSSEHTKNIMSHKRPFISATCGYGKYFDEPLQKGGESKLN